MHHPNALAALADANRSRARHASDEKSKAVRDALDILGADAPYRLVEAGRLRLAYPGLSLRDLGAKANPPMSKDVIAALLTRLLAKAERRRVAR